MVRILLACAVLLSLTSVARADQISRLTVDITNRGCIIDIAPRSVRGPILLNDASLALWISPIDVVGSIVKIAVTPNQGLVKSVNFCGYKTVAGSYGVTAVFDGLSEVDYHRYGALRGTAVITIPEGNYTIPHDHIAESPPELIMCSRVAPAPVPQPESASSRRVWLIGASAALFAMLALFVFARRRSVDTYIV
jgi:hypothetical protein